jgi:uncharacterized caspase-like protein
MRQALILLSAVLAVAVVGHLGAAAAEQRVALVIGNGAYQNVTPLKNPVGDAKLMAEALKSVGFELVGGEPLIDADKPTLERAIRSFGQALRGGAVGLFYYSGHGVQIGGANYLVPVGANVAEELDAKFELVDAGLVLDAMANARNRLNIVSLDACRNNPFGGRGVRGFVAGLGEVLAPAGTVISYATQPGAVALDGAGEHSPYTQALAKAIREPGRDVFATFNEVGLRVKEVTGGLQQPWLATSPIDGQFFFVPGDPGDANRAALEAEKRKAEADAATAEAAAARAQALADAASRAQADAQAKADAAERAKAQAEAAAEKSAAAAAREHETASKSEADAKAARARAEAIATKAQADAAKSDAQAQAAIKAEAAAKAAEARAEAELARAKAASTSRQQMAAAAPPPGPPPHRTRSTARFDGTWTGTLACVPVNGVHGFSRPFVALVKEGHLQVRMGVPDTPGWSAIDGDVDGDGKLQAKQTGLAGNNSPLPPGTPMTARFLGALGDKAGRATRIRGRPCTLTFQRL